MLVFNVSGLQAEPVHWQLDFLSVVVVWLFFVGSWFEFELLCFIDFSNLFRPPSGARALAAGLETP